jgi:hypothetical protein
MRIGVMSEPPPTPVKPTNPPTTTPESTYKGSILAKMLMVPL